MTDDQILLRDNVRRILETSDAGERGEALDDWPSQIWTELVKAGMTGVGIPETSGGSGGTLGDSATLVFEVGRSASMLPLPETVMLANWLSETAGWPFVDGAATIALDSRRTLEVQKSGSSIRLHGEAVSVPWGRTAQRVFLAMDTKGGPILVWLEPGDFSVDPDENLAREPRDTLVLRGAIVRDDRWLLSPIPLVAIRKRGALMRSVAMSGAMSSVFDLTTTYARSREQFGRPIANFQAVQNLLARLASEVYASVIATRTAIDAIESGDGTLEALAAIVRVSRAATSAARIAHQLHGAIGVTREYPLHLLTNRLWCWRDEFGGEIEWSRFLNEYLHERGGANQLWSLVTGHGEEIK